MTRFLRYLAPNLVTLSSLTFGMLSIASTIQGRFAQAAWFVVFSVLTDKLDGFVARLVKGTSELGVQLDSFADFLNFGIAPGVLFYVWFGHKPLVVAACATWILAVTFRLARYNIVGDDPKCRKIFFGVPTTLMGGIVCALFLTSLKYGAGTDGAWRFESAKLPMTIGPGIWKAFPWILFGGAFLMASTFKIPKLGVSRWKPLTYFIFLNVAVGYTLGFARKAPEFLLLIASLYTTVSIVWGLFSREVKGLVAPPIFPRQDPLPGHEPQRPEEDSVPESAA